MSIDEVDDCWTADHPPADFAFASGARCVGRTELFFPTYNERPTTRERRERRARQLCERCPAQEACRSFARRHGEYGVWGGETDEERVLAGVRLRYPYSPKTIKRERQRLSRSGDDEAEPGPDELAAVEAWLAELDLAS